MPYIYDLVDPQELVGFVRDLRFDEFSLDRFLPNRNINSIDYAFTRADRSDQEMAQYRTWDTPAPIAERQGITRVEGEVAPISRKIKLGEEDYHRLLSMRGGADQSTIDQIFDDAENMMRAVQARIEKARGETLYDAKLVLNENGVKLTADWGLDASHRIAVPTPAWSDPAAPIIQDMVEWMDIYTGTNGVPPGMALTSTKVIGYMLRNDEIRTFAGMGNTPGTPPLVTREAVGGVLQAHGLPPVEAYDTTVRVNGAAVRVIPEDRFIYLPPAGEPLGNTFFAPTAESRILVRDGQLAGGQEAGVIAVVEEDFDPPGIWTKGAGVAVPVLGNPNLILTAEVF